MLLLLIDTIVCECGVETIDGISLLITTIRGIQDNKTISYASGEGETIEGLIANP